MNIYLQELKMYRKSLLIWTVSLCLVAIVFLCLYPSYTKDTVTVKQLLAGYSPQVLTAFGLSLDNFFSLLGFYGFVFLYVMLSGAIQAMNLGLSLLSKEIRGKMADFLLSKPVTRNRILTVKLLAALTCLVITNVVYILTAYVTALAVQTEPFSRKDFMLISLSLFFVQLIFLSLGFLISVIVPKIKSVLPVSLATVFGFFFVYMFNSVINDQVFKYLTPFRYFDTIYIIQHSGYDPQYLLLTFGFVTLAIIVSYVIYSRKEIPAP